MVDKLKDKFLPKDYQLSLFINMKILRKKQLTVKGYMEEFYKVNTRVGYVEYFPNGVARYINGLRFEIQDEVNLLCPSCVKEAYQFGLKAKEKLERKIQEKIWGTFQGRDPTRGKGRPIEAGSSGQS